MSKSPISWVGGKFYLANKIIKYFPEHERYIEPFGGACHILFRKEPSKMEVFNDLDARLVNFFDVVKRKPEELYKELDFSLYARDAFNYALSHMNEGTDVQRAARFYTVNRQCFGGKMKTWAIMAGGFDNYEERIREAHERIKGVYIENRDFRQLIPQFDSKDALFLCDPPYMFNEARSNTRAYAHEMTTTDHAALVDILKNIKGKFILCGYENELYACFNKINIGISNMMVKKTIGEPRMKKQEYIWTNF